MRILICGTTTFSFLVAKYLSLDGFDVVIVDNDISNLDKFNEIDVHIFNKNPSMLSSLIEIQRLGDIDVVIAATKSDEVNLIISKNTKDILHIDNIICCISFEYSMDRNTSDLINNFGMNYLIIGEKEIAREIVSYAIDNPIHSIHNFFDDKLSVIGIKIKDYEDCNINKFVDKFYIDNYKIIGLLRNEDVIFSLDACLQKDDIIYFITESGNLKKILDIMNENKTKNILIIGGGDVGTAIVKQFYKKKDFYNLKIIEQNKNRALFVKDLFPKCDVINGDILDREIMDEANLFGSDIVISCTNNFALNGLVSTISKNNKNIKTIALMNSYDMCDLLSDIDLIVDPYYAVISKIKGMIFGFSFSDIVSIAKHKLHVAHIDLKKISFKEETIISDINNSYCKILCCKEKNDDNFCFDLIDEDKLSDYFSVFIVYNKIDLSKVMFNLRKFINK